MVVGILTLDLATLEARSLKDKRSVIHGLKKRLGNRFNVSIAEVAHLDTPKRCGLAVAMVTREARPLHAQFDKLVDVVRATPRLTLIDYTRNIV